MRSTRSLAEDVAAVNVHVGMNTRRTLLYSTAFLETIFTYIYIYLANLDIRGV